MWMPKAANILSLSSVLLMVSVTEFYALVEYLGP